MFVEKLKVRNSTKELKYNLLKSLVDVCNALNLNPSITQCTANWWIYFAKMKIADARGDATTSNAYFAAVTQNIIDEHALRFQKLSKSEARGLASLLVGAGMLGHDAKRWEKAKELLEIYYSELFAILAERHSKN